MVTVEDADSVAAFANFTASAGGAASAPAAAEAAAPTPVQHTPAPQQAAPAPSFSSSSSSSSSSERVFISPLAKRLALEKGLDIAALIGTGPRGRVIAADVRE